MALADESGLSRNFAEAAATYIDAIQSEILKKRR
jgi:hypothetical protein